MFQVPTDCLGRDSLLQILAFTDEFLDRMSVTDPCNVLRDDRALVKIRGHIMGGCANDLYAARVSLVIGAASHKCRQKAMMNIYHRNSSFVEKSGAQDLHVAGQNKQIDFVLPKNA